MKIPKILYSLIIPISLITSSALQADDFIGLKPMLKDVNVANGGKEVIVPRIDIFDKPGTNDDRVKVLLDIYPVGSTTRLYRKTQQVVVAPDVPCAPGYQWEELDFDVKLLGIDGPWVTVALNIYRECQDANFNWNETEHTFIYTADVSSQSGNVWARSYPFPLIGANYIDANSDGTNEVVVGMARNIIGTDSEMLRTVILTRSNGNVAYPSREYPLLFSY